MKKHFCIFFVLIVTTGLVRAQPIIEWSKCFGGDLRQECYSLQQTYDGGYIVAGGSNGIGGDVTINLGSIDFWLVKTDSAGNIEWQKSYGGMGWDMAFSIMQTPDSGYVITGYVGGNGAFVTNHHGGNDLWVLKLDAAGLFQWQSCLGSAGNEEGNKILLTNDGGYIVAGRGMENYWVVKLDSAGTMLWNQYYGGNKYEVAYDIIHNGSGGYVLAGEASSNNGDVTGIHVGGPNSMSPTSDFWIVNIDSAGNIIWQKCFGGTEDELANAIVKTSDGGYVITGYTESNDGDVIGWHPGFQGADPIRDAWIIKIDSMGTLEWQHCYGGSGYEAGYSILETPDAGFLFCGYTESSDGDVDLKYGFYDIWLIQTDSAGAILWQGYYGSSRPDIGTDIIQTQDGQYAFCGTVQKGDGDVSGFHWDPMNYYHPDYWLVKLSDISTTNVQPAVCSQCVGTATVSMTGGVAPFTYLWSNGQTTNSVDSLCAGFCTVTITDGTGAVSSGYFNLINDTVTITMTQTNASCWNCPDGSATIHPVGGSGVYSYSWIGFPDTTQTLSSIPHDWYTGCVTDSMGCFICRSIEVKSPVGLPEINNDFVSLTPNPASENVVVNFSAGFNPNENYQLEISTVHGKVIYNEKLVSESTTIDISAIAEGMYFVRIFSKNKSAITKLIKH